MPSKTAIIALVLSLGTALPAQAGKVHCPSAPANQEKLQRDIDGLIKLRQEMNVEFEGVLQQDMRSAAEGDREAAHRSTAVKLAFSRNRLNKKIESKQKELADLSKEFCKQCAPDKKAKDKLELFCELCEDASRCPEDQEN